MMAKKLLLFTTAILAVGIAGAACSGDDDDDGSGAYSLSSGEYTLDITDVPTNTCWPASNPLPLPLTSLDPTISIISTNGEAFQIAIPPPVGDVIPPVVGTIDGNDLAASGSVSNYAIDTSGCTISVTANFDGELTGDDEFTGNLDATLDFPAANAANCAQYVGEAFPGTDGLVPFPTLTNGSSGTCDLTITGDGFPEQS